jgi:2-oxoglutarate dehydrogenase E2 component (dihydrolipoamide succinyltransferase)
LGEIEYYKPSLNGENMIIDVKVPQLSESVAEATLVSWHKKAGEAVPATKT